MSSCPSSSLHVGASGSDAVGAMFLLLLVLPSKRWAMI